MPQIAVAVAASAAGSFAAGAIGTGFLAAIGGALAATAVTVAGSALLLKKPKVPALQQEAQGILSLTRSSIEPHKIIYGTRRVSGVVTFMESTNSTKYTDVQTGEEKTFEGDNAALHMVITLAGHEVAAIDEIYIDDEAITLDGNGEVVEEKFHIDNAPAIRVCKHLGHEDQSADPFLKDEVEKWTENHRLRGIAYIYVRLIYNRNVWPSGIPNITAIIKGKKVYDPRVEATVFSNNWALCVRDYLTNSGYGLSADVEEIDDISIIAAANICDEDVPMKGGGTQKRYTCDGIIDTGKKPIDALTELTTASGGVITYSGGMFKVFAAAYNTPIANIDETWLRGDIELQDRPSQKDMFNTVRGIYVDPQKLYQPTDLPELKNQSLVLEDGGRTVTQDFEFPFTVDPQCGQRLMKLYLLNARHAQKINLPCNQKAMQLQIHDVVTFTSDVLGIYSKEFRVVGWSLNEDASIDIVLKEEAPDIYAFNPEEDVIILANAEGTNLPDQRVVSAPGVPDIVEDLIQTTGGGGLKPRVKVSWQESTDVFAVLYTLEYKKQGDADWVVAGQTREAFFTIHDVQPAIYEFRVKATSSIGVDSSYVSSMKEVRGLSAPPADITGFSLNGLGGNAHLTWDEVPDLDVKAGGKVRLRFTSDPEPAWSKGYDISDALPGVATTHVVPLLNGTYMVKAVDSSGNESINAATITATLTSLLNMNVIEEFVDGPSNGFPGTKTNMYFDENTQGLILAPKLFFDDFIEPFDSYTGLFNDFGRGSYKEIGSYELSDILNLGRVATFKCSADIDSSIYDAAQSFDHNLLMFDAQQGMFDGGDLASVSVNFYIRTTNDDPNGTPAWTEWKKFVAGEFTARAAQFKCVFLSNNSAHNIHVNRISFNIDVPDMQENGFITSLNNADVSVTFAKPFQAIPNIGFSISGLQSGEYVDHSNITRTGFDLSIRDVNGNRVVRDTGYIAIGY